MAIASSCLKGLGRTWQNCQVIAADAGNYTIYRTTLGIKILLLYLVLPKCPLPNIRGAAHLQRSSLTTLQSSKKWITNLIINFGDAPNALKHIRLDSTLKAMTIIVSYISLIRKSAPMHHRLSATKLSSP